jgi:hypothetical protein
VFLFTVIRQKAWITWLIAKTRRIRQEIIRGLSPSATEVAFKTHQSRLNHAVSRNLSFLPRILRYVGLPHVYTHHNIALTMVEYLQPHPFVAYQSQFNTVNKPKAK